MKVVDPWGQLYLRDSSSMRLSASRVASMAALCAACGVNVGSAGADAYIFMDASGSNDPPIAGDCPVFPSNNMFNTPIGALPADPASASYITTIGSGKLHLDLGQDFDPTSDTYYGIPFQAV